MNNTILNNGTLFIALLTILKHIINIANVKGVGSMSRVYLLIPLLLLVTVNTLVLVHSMAVEDIYGSGNVVYVPDDYSSIQDAIDNTGNNTIIYVKTGIYSGFHLSRRNNVTIKALGDVVIDGGGRAGYGIIISKCSYCSIEGFKIRNYITHGDNEGGGIKSLGIGNITLENIEVYSTSIGIYVESEYTTIRNVHVHDVDTGVSVALAKLVFIYYAIIENAEKGVDMYLGKTTLISGTIIKNCTTGVHYYYYSQFNTISNTTISNTDVAVFAETYSDVTISYSEIRDSNKAFYVDDNSYIRAYLNSILGVNSVTVEKHYSSVDLYSSEKLYYYYHNQIYISYLGNYYGEDNIVDENEDGVEDNPPYRLREPLMNYIIIPYPSFTDLPLRTKIVEEPPQEAAPGSEMTIRIRLENLNTVDKKYYVEFYSSTTLSYMYISTMTKSVDNVDRLSSELTVEKSSTDYLGLVCKLPSDYSGTITLGFRIIDASTNETVLEKEYSIAVNPSATSPTTTTPATSQQPTTQPTGPGETGGSGTTATPGGGESSGTQPSGADYTLVAIAVIIIVALAVVAFILMRRR